MPRAIDGTRRKEHRKKLQKLAKGFWGRRKNLYRTSKDAVSKSLQYAYRDRRAKKREFRQLWIARISAAARAQGITYSELIYKLKLKEIHLNRRQLSNLAIQDISIFNKIVETVQ